MPTIRQKRLAEEIIKNVKAKKPKTAIELLKSSNYSTTTSETKSTDIINSEGVQEALEDYGFTEENAKKVVSQILLNEKVEPNARLKAASEVFKVRGSYAPDKTLNVNLDISQEAEIKANEIISRYLNGNN